MLKIKFLLKILFIRFMFLGTLGAFAQPNIHFFAKYNPHVSLYKEVVGEAIYSTQWLGINSLFYDTSDFIGGYDYGLSFCTCGPFDLKVRYSDSVVHTIDLGTTISDWGDIFINGDGVISFDKDSTELQRDSMEVWGNMLFTIAEEIPISNNITKTTIAGRNAAVYVPQSDTTNKDICFLFFSGLGEAGSNYEKLFVHGPAKFAREGWEPNFTVIAVQPSYGWVPHTEVKKIIDDILKKYPHVKTFSGTGLSAGAFGWFNFLANYPSYWPLISSVILFSMDTPLDEKPFKTIPIWGISGNKSESRYLKLKNFINLLAGKGYNAKFSEYNSGHCCWNTYYNPAYKFNGESIYEWAVKQYKRPKPPIPPTNEPQVGDTISCTILGKIILRKTTDSSFYFERIKN